jgi:hypothetical protein
MLLLYTKLFGYKLTSSEPENMPNKSNFNEFHADSEHKSFTKVESTKLAEEIRNLKQAYHLERRLFM